MWTSGLPGSPQHHTIERQLEPWDNQHVHGEGGPEVLTCSFSVETTAEGTLFQAVVSEQEVRVPQSLMS